MGAFDSEFSATVFRARRPATGWPVRFAVITACDPLGARLGKEENRGRNIALQGQLHREGVPCFPADGWAPDGSHHEEGFGCEVASLDRAVGIALAWNQLAVFWVEDDRLELVDTEPLRRQPLGSWSERVIGEPP